MRLIIGLIIFWISILSIKIFIERNIKVPKVFSLAVTFTLIGLYLFVLGIINMMKLGSLILIFLAMIYFIYLIYKKEITIKYIKECLKNKVNIIVIILFILITIISCNLHLIHYDNYSHWGLIVRVLFDFDRLPNFENNYVMFKGYQPGSACFIYLMGLLCGKKDYVMILGQNYLVFAYFTVLFNYIKNKKDILKALLLVCFYIFIVVTSGISYNNLLVDTLIGVMLIVGLLIVNYYKDDFKKVFLYVLPITIYLLLVKNIGLVLAGFICLYILFISYKEKKLVEGIKYVFYIGLILLLVLFIWNSHVSLVYGHWALNTKHSLSLQNIYTSLKAIGFTNILSFIKMYMINLFKLSNNLPNVYMLVLNIVGIIFISLVKDKKKVLNYLLLLNGIYLFYYLLLGVMYIFSMPWEEAKVLAGYIRYMMTIVDVIIGLFIIFLFTFKGKIKYKNIFIVGFSILLLSSIFIDYGSFLCLLGRDGYEGSLVSNVDKIIDKVPTDKENYYLYLKDIDDPYYYKFIITYKLQKNNIYIIGVDCKLEDVASDSYLLFYDEELDDNYKKINDITYYKK